MCHPRVRRDVAWVVRADTSARGSRLARSLLSSAGILDTEGVARMCCAREVASRGWMPVRTPPTGIHVRHHRLIGVTHLFTRHRSARGKNLYTRDHRNSRLSSRRVHGRLEIPCTNLTSLHPLLGSARRRREIQPVCLTDPCREEYPSPRNAAPIGGGAGCFMRPTLRAIAGIVARYFTGVWFAPRPGV